MNLYINFSSSFSGTEIYMDGRKDHQYERILGTSNRFDAEENVCMYNDI
jgi:hypothetical protein